MFFWNKIKMKKIYSKKSETKDSDKAYPICMDSIQGTEGPKADWSEEADDKFDRCVEKVKEESSKKKSLKEAKKKKDPCWKGYEQIGMKEKDGKEVPNCVPKKKSNIIFDIFKASQIEDEGVELNDNDLAQKLERFSQLVSAHDLTYQYSDDSRMYNIGKRQLQEINQLAKEIPMDDAKRIWNANVDEKLVPNARYQFYWK